MTSPTSLEQQARELHSCWTCREKTFAEITHSSQQDGGQLYRCVNCKAIYPEKALSTPQPPHQNVGKEGLVERLLTDFYVSSSYDPNAARPADTVKAAIEFAIREAAARIEGLEKALGTAAEAFGKYAGRLKEYGFDNSAPSFEALARMCREALSNSGGGGD